MRDVKAEVDSGVRFLLKFSADRTLVSTICHAVDVLKALERTTKRIKEHMLEHNEDRSHLILW